MKCMTEFRNGGPMWPICSCLSNYVRCFVGLRLKQRFLYINGLKITMKRPARQAVEAQNQLAQGRNSKCFQVAPNSAPSPNIHTFAVRDSWAPLRAMPSRSADLIVMQENLGRDLLTKYPAISSNIQQYPAISSYTRFPAQNLAMQCPLQAPILYVVWWGTMCS